MKKYGILGWSLRFFHDECTQQERIRPNFDLRPKFAKFFSQEGLQSAA